ncbi:DNA-processing protein DprA [Marininema halotolerans]|uniref:DNA processing protein n=1 Tax=Marininema halotolerans TaxID=1155944 RepID=A0A1I6QPZ9_9BACL|nr:DNA-processing protein DprA [Marininema halotolerans]SFS54368.1 DNA processing protein [Marininema halotolerans]
MTKAWTKREGLIALHQVQGVGWHTIDQLFHGGWDPSLSMKESREVFNKISWRQKKLPEILAKKWTSSFVQRVQEELSHRKIQALTIWDRDYPELLRKLPQPPWILYLKGNRSLLNGRCLAVVGTRKPTHYGKNITKSLMTEVVAQGWTVVSGMAAGIDGDAHRSVLNTGGKTIAVLGSGVDVVYPKHHQSLYERLVQEGLVLSEMAPGTKPHPGLFPQRNRIISGLSHGVLVVEAAERSGSLITADCSLEQGRDVFAIPGPITSEKSLGTNRLIQQGAKCVLSGSDIVEEFPHFSHDDEQGTSEHAVSPLEGLSNEEKVLFQLFADDPLPLEALQWHSNISLGLLHQLLLTLQVKGKIKQLPGGRYIKQ